MKLPLDSREARLLKTFLAVYACAIFGFTALTVIALCWDNLKSLF